MSTIAYRTLTLVGCALVATTVVACGGGGESTGGGGFFARDPARPVVANTQHDYHAFGDSNMIVTVRNVGGDGRIKVIVTAYRDKARTKRIDSWSTLVYLKKGQEATVTVPLRGLSEGLGAHARTEAVAD
ncbi:hypothetical protein J8F10_16485 [Gemmata sp. G18]|uniref:Uncharacterized protein n=1 Tax=Gemmata palustris TaxID=2822762 RepID=A0ABS5BUA1_9BACT|nr:hypothetical protein [Gemmata palustris]MBP3956870.1 hypothetical protein [Gemmata palustris]